jgi:GTPase-activating protein that regulates ARFs (ADP-ribosylation factors), involved in ARF-mediated vesicular transport
MEQLLAANPNCADCENPNPDRANMQLGVFLCEACAAVHSKLFHTNARKISEDLQEEEINFLLNNGNQKINAKLMKNITPWTVSLKTFNFS